MLKHLIGFVFVTIMSQGIMAQHPATAQDMDVYDVETPSVKYTTGSDSDNDTSEVYAFVDELPVFKEDMLVFIEQNYVFSAKIFATGRAGSIYVGFIVEKDGSISNVKVFPGKGLTVEQNVEAERVVKLTSGKWVPGKINGYPVRFMNKVKFVFTEEMFE